MIGDTKAILKTGQAVTLRELGTRQNEGLVEWRKDGIYTHHKNYRVFNVGETSYFIQLFLTNGLCIQCPLHDRVLLYDGTYEKASNLTIYSRLKTLTADIGVRNIKFLYEEVPVDVYDVYHPSAKNYALHCGIFIKSIER